MSGAVILVGSSSGIGEALARRYAAMGRPLALLARSGDKLEAIAQSLQSTSEAEVLCFAHDVRESSAVPDLFEEIERRLGPADILVFAAGVLPREESAENFRDTIDTGLTGACAWFHEAAKRFQERRQGSIVGISSIAGDRGRSAYPAYHAAKAGLSTFLESLHYRLHRYGVSVVTVKPGFIDTRMTQGLEGMFWLISADRAAEIIVRKVAAQVRVAYVPARWRLVSWAVCSVPAFLMRRMRF